MACCAKQLRVGGITNCRECDTSPSGHSRGSKALPDANTVSALCTLLVPAAKARLAVPPPAAGTGGGGGGAASGGTGDALRACMRQQAQQSQVGLRAAHRDINSQRAWAKTHLPPACSCCNSCSPAMLTQ